MQVGQVQRLLDAGSISSSTIMGFILELAGGDICGGRRPGGGGTRRDTGVGQLPGGGTRRLVCLREWDGFESRFGVGADDGGLEEVDAAGVVADLGRG